MMRATIYVLILISILSINLFAKKTLEDINLTNNEIVYLETRKIFTVCYTNRSSPFVIEDKKKITGISVEFLNLISKKLDMQFKMLKVENFEQSRLYFEEGKCDILPLISTYLKNDSLIMPSHRLGRDNLVLVTKVDEPYLLDFGDLNNKTIALHKDLINIKKYLHELYPNIEIVPAKGLGLKKILKGKVYGAIASSFKMSYRIRHAFPHELKIMGIVGDRQGSGSFGVNIKEPFLLSILNKAIDEISEKQRREILNSWYNVKVEKGIDYWFVLKTIGILLIVLIIIIFVYLKQRKLNQKINDLNGVLEERVKSEVEKNREKDIYLFQQSRLAQMGELLSMIAHQWRQPLALINGTILVMQLDFMKKKFDLDKEEDKKRLFSYLDDKFDEIEGYVKFLSNTVTDFTTFYEPSKVKELVSINTPVEDALNMLSSMLKIKGITLLIDYQTDKLMLLHKNEITQVILNILQNSQDNFDKQNKINPKIEIITKEEDGNIIIAISDNGGGIDESILPKIFDPYFSTKYSTWGTGLGLYMSKMIIEEHNNGKLKAENNKQGMLFSINLIN